MPSNIVSSRQECRVMIKLYKIAKSTLRIEADIDIINELADIMQFRPEGYRFMPAYKSGLWNGFIELLDRNKKTISIGLLPEVIAFARRREYRIEIKGELLKEIKAEPYINDWREFCAFQPHEYQRLASIKALSLNYALILSPTGSGKSFILYQMINYLLHNTNMNILVTVPKIQLVEQIYGDFIDYEIGRNTISDQVHLIYGGKEVHTKKRIVVSTWQTMIKQPKEYFTRFNAYFCDEAHQADGKSITRIISHLKNADIKIGMTGTLDGTKCHEMQLRSLFGPIVKTKSTKELMESGFLTKLNIDVRLLKHTSSSYIKGLLYQEEMAILITNHTRNEFIVKTALEQTHNTLVLFNYVDTHGKILYNRAKEICAESHKEVYYISGETDIDERELIRKKFSEQDNIVLFASLGTFSAGINAPNIHYLIMAHPSKSRIRNLQSIGRALRKNEGKQVATLIDIADDIYPSSKSKSYTYQHLIDRLQIYESEKFNYRMSEIEI